MRVSEGRTVRSASEISSGSETKPGISASLTSGAAMTVTSGVMDWKTIAETTRTAVRTGTRSLLFTGSPLSLASEGAREELSDGDHQENRHREHDEAGIVVVEADREVAGREVGDEHDRDDAHHVAENRERDGRGEENAAAEPGRRVEVGLGARDRHQREERAESAARVGDVDRERSVGRADHRALADDLGAAALEDGASRGARKEAEVDGHDVEEGRERNAEREEERRKRDAFRSRRAEHRPGNGDEKPDERDDLKAELESAGAEEAEREKRQRRDEAPGARLAD